MLERFFPGRNDVKRLLMEPIAYANGSTLDDPAITYGIVFSNFMGSGVYTFRGGSDLLIEKMTDELRKNGVELRKKVLVERILVEERGGTKVACGIVAKGGRVIRAKAVLSNANIKNTVFRLAGAENFPAGLRRGRPGGQDQLELLPGLPRHPKGESIPHIGDLVFNSASPGVQQRGADGPAHDQPDLLGLLSRHPARARTATRSSPRSTASTRTGARSRRPSTRPRRSA
jgi:all-trans-retinol 13,14-reductase